MIELRRHPRGHRLYVMQRRVHHFWIGAGLTAGAAIVRRPRLALAAAIYMATDIRDFPFRDTDNH